MNIAGKPFERPLLVIPVLAALPLGALIYLVLQPPAWAASADAVHQAAIIVAGLALSLGALSSVKDLGSITPFLKTSSDRL